MPTHQMQLGCITHPIPQEIPLQFLNPISHSCRNSEQRKNEENCLMIG